MKFPLLSKAMALGAVVLGLLWSLWSVQSIVQERQARQAEAEHSVANSLASSQTLLGPVLSRVCTETWVSGETAKPESKPIVETKSYITHLQPDQIKVDAKVEMTPRYRGMFKVNGYGMKALIAAQWPDAALLTVAPDHPNGKISCDAPKLAVALSDARGIRVAELHVNGQAAAIQPGSGMEAYPRGFQSTLNGDVWPASGPISVVLDL